MSFENLGLIEPLLRAIQSQGYTVPTPIQKQAIPTALAGRDLLGCAQTGTGKTAAFALPILQRFATSAAGSEPPARPNRGRSGSAAPRPIRALVLAPTRELAGQIGQSLNLYGRHTRLRSAVIFGGVKQNAQVQSLRAGVDILVATPGRLLDLMGQKLLSLQALEFLVLDEADRMLDMGFIPDIRRIVAQVPAQRQTLLFSATMPREIRALADSLLRDPLEVSVAISKPVEAVRQALYFVDPRVKPALLEQVLTDPTLTRALVFSRTKHGADHIVRRLAKVNLVAEAIHGNKSQNARQRALGNFKSGATRILVASDLAARGLDVADISHVINYDLPHEPETYIHRIGRTGRAGAEGVAISFCTEDQRSDLVTIERLLGKKIPVERHGLPTPSGPAEPAGPERRDSARSPRVHHRPAQGHVRSAKSAAPLPEQKQSQFWQRQRSKSRSHSPGPRPHRAAP